MPHWPRPQRCLNDVDIESPALSRLLASLDRLDGPGGVVGVARHGVVLHRRGYGLANVEHAVAMTADTRLRIASTTKQFTCLAVLLLAEAGRLDIDAPARRWLPELHEMPGEPTLRQLMNHTSGWRCHVDLAELANGDSLQPRGAAFAALLRQRALNTVPGRQMLYSNGGYQLLTHVVERAAGMPFASFLKQRIFEPLGMVDTEVVESDLDIRPRLAGLYERRPDGRCRRGVFPSEEIRGEGGIVSTVDDMLRWMANLRGPHTVGSEASWRQLLAPVLLDGQVLSSYGLGVIRHRHRGVEVIHHPGGARGCACQMLTVPKEGLDIIVMTNGAPLSPVALAFDIVEAVLGADALAPPAVHAAAADFRPLVDAAYHDRDSGMLVAFSDVAGQLRLSLLGSLPLPLRREGTALRMEVEDLAAGPYGLSLAALRPGDPAPDELQCLEGARPHCLRRLDLNAAALDDDLLGRYDAPELAATAHVERHAEVLRLTFQGETGRNVLRLHPLDAHVMAWTAETPFVTHGVLNVDRQHGRVAGLRLHSLRSRDVLLRRA